MHAIESSMGQSQHEKVRISMTATKQPGALPTSMKAVRLHDYNGLDGLIYEDAPVPQPGEGQVLIHVRAMGINPFDWKVAEGHFKEFLPLQLPAIIGSDLAGVVEAVGPGVTFLKPGMMVYGQADFMASGAYAEYALAKAGEVATKPRTLTFAQAASVPVIAMTAWQALMIIGGLQRGQSVLIHGAAGGVGSYAVQFASLLDCHIVATAAGEDAAYLHELGAVEVINYQNPPSQNFTSGMDLVLDTIGGETRQRSWGALKPGGILITTTDPPSPEEAKEHNVRAEMIQMKPSALQLDDIAKKLDSGQIKARVGAELPLSEARQALERLRKGGTRGKIILNVSD